MSESESETEPFDPTRYQSLPRLSPQTTQALAKSLLARTPAFASERVRRAASHLAHDLDELDRTLGGGGSPLSREVAASEAELDDYLDGLWHTLYMRLSAWQPYGRPGMWQVAAATPLPVVDYDRMKRRATRAREISSVLFGPEGPQFVAHGYRTQSLEMAKRLAVIDERDWAKDIGKLAGRELLAALREAQVVYEAMVAARTARGPAGSVRRASHQTQWQIGLYVVHVLSMVDPSVPASVAAVRDALRPLLALRRMPSADGLSMSESSEWTFDGTR